MTFFTYKFFAGCSALLNLFLVSLIGSIPLRKLVYRVHELPPSMDHLVYDFGQLTGNTEDRYIWRIVSHFVSISTTCVSLCAVGEYISHLEVYVGSLCHWLMFSGAFTVLPLQVPQCTQDHIS